MTIWFTNGLNGLKTEQLDSKDYASIQQALSAIEAWKATLEAKKHFKIEPYNRLLFNESSIVVDFGSYSTFFVIDGISKQQLEDFKLQ